MSKKSPSLIQSLIPIVVLVGLILTNVIFLGDYTLSGANQLALILASAVAAFIAMLNGLSWEEMLEGIVTTISSAMPAIIILLVIGMLSGSWMISGIVPSMIYYGLNVLRPEYFLPATVVLCSVVSVSVGSSWSTIATVGVALLGIGDALGFSPSVVAGAIISGAYFGDKVSPLSDTTNLAAAVTNTPLFTHIRFMMYTTIPSIIITILLFVAITFWGSAEVGGASSDQIQSSIASLYTVSPFLFLVPLLVIVLIIKKVPAIPVLFIGAILGIIVAAVFQQDMIQMLLGGAKEGLAGTYKILATSMFGHTAVNSGMPEVDSLLSTGGMLGMLNTVWLIITAMIFGGIIEAGQFLERITILITKRVSRARGLVTATAGTAVLFNITAGDQYMSIVIPGKMFGRSYMRARLKSQLLSRTLEDSATVTSVLIPWNTCGATQASILGVATIAYAPFAFFCYLSPIITIAWAWLGIKIPKIDENSTTNKTTDKIPG